MLLNECKNEIQTSNITKLPIIKKKKENRETELFIFPKIKHFHLIDIQRLCVLRSTSKTVPRIFIFTAEQQNVIMGRVKQI